MKPDKDGLLIWASYLALLFVVVEALVVKSAELTKVAAQEASIIYHHTTPEARHFVLLALGVALGAMASRRR